MKVFILIRDVDYSPGDILDVFDHHPNMSEIAEAHNKSGYGWGDSYHVEEWKINEETP